jgi:hypothetical protein
MMRAMKRAAIGVVSMQMIGIAAVKAQTADDMVVSVSAHMTRTNGAEDPPGMFLTTGPLSQKGTAAGRFSVGRCGAMTLEARAEGPFREDATSGWRVEIIPIRVTEGAATLRLKWFRALDTSSGMQPASEDVELTLRPGQSRPMDTVAIPPDKETGRRCAVWDNRGKQAEYSAVSLRVAVDYQPWDWQERRLMAADLWLIERLPTGAERTQSLSVRALPHREIPFYFEAIRQDSLSLEILGSVVARPESDGVAVELETRSRWGPTAFDWRKDEHRATGTVRIPGDVQVRRIESHVRVKPDETVEVALPQLEGSAGPFTARKYAIRIRVRQLR